MYCAPAYSQIKLYRHLLYKLLESLFNICKVWKLMFTNFAGVIRIVPTSVFKHFRQLKLLDKKQLFSIFYSTNIENNKTRWYPKKNNNYTSTHSQLCDQCTFTTIKIFIWRVVTEKNTLYWYTWKSNLLKSWKQQKCPCLFQLPDDCAKLWVA